MVIGQMEAFVQWNSEDAKFVMWREWKFYAAFPLWLLIFIPVSLQFKIIIQFVLRIRFLAFGFGYYWRGDLQRADTGLCGGSRALQDTHLNARSSAWGDLSVRGFVFWLEVKMFLSGHIGIF